MGEFTTAFDMLGINPLDFQVYQVPAHDDNFPLRIFIFGGKIITAAQGAALNTKGGWDNAQDDILRCVHFFMHTNGKCFFCLY
jgi:hypothetical protein